MDAPDVVDLPRQVAPGDNVDVSVGLIAPVEPGTHQGFWQLRDPSGNLFGVGSSADRPIWTKIEVVIPSPFTLTAQAAITPTATLPAPTPEAPSAYDFVDNVCLAEWTNRDGRLPCPGTDGDLAGFVLIVDQPELEDGTTTASSALLTFPQPSEGGFVQATYPKFVVQPGDHFRTVVSCQGGATSCSVLYRLSYEDASGQVKDLWALGEFYDGKSVDLDLDLTPLAGQEVRFILNVTSLGSTVGDRALWVGPRIIRVEPAATPTLTPTPIPSPTGTVAPTLAPTPTATPVPVQPPAEPPTFFERLREWIADLFKRIFGN